MYFAFLTTKLLKNFLLSSEHQKIISSAHLKHLSSLRFTLLYPLSSLPLPLSGASRDRTDDPLLAKQMLSQLSYGPSSLLHLHLLWAWVDLNHRPHAYQACALTN